jgi:hypothetical protein
VGAIDVTTWSALGVTLSILGMVVSVLVWRARGAAAGLRAVAWSLLPAAAGLTGTLRLFAEIVDRVGSWALGLVFSPVVWLGIALLGLSVVLFGVSAVLRRRGAGTAGRKAVTTRQQRPGAPAAARDQDLDDIEAILRKHGIS